MDQPSARQIIRRITAWAAAERDICALGIVGSYARGCATPESDLDVVVLCVDTKTYLAELGWLATFGNCASVELMEYGVVTAVFAAYDFGLEIEFGIAPRSWADVPVDPGTARVIADGINICYDPENLLSTAAQFVENR